MSKPQEMIQLENVGGHYPYANVSQGSVSTILSDVRRSVSAFNPFAFRQVPSQDRVAFGLRHGNNMYIPEPYPNGVSFGGFLPNHYDPLKSLSRKPMGYQLGKYAPGPHSILCVSSEKLPKGCARSVYNYKRCEIVNGEQKCEQEKQDILSICPNWALDGLKEKSKQLSKFIGIQNQQYQRAMSVSQYNEGRDPSDVSDKTWIHGTRHHLRPDTMWADDRYANITQKEVDEAKVSMLAKRANNKKQDDHSHGHGHHHYDFKSASIKEPKTLYP